MSTVTLGHMRALGYCNRGLRRWLADRGVVWAEFLEHGVDGELLRGSGDAMAIAAADLADAEAVAPGKNTKRGGCV